MNRFFKVILVGVLAGAGSLSLQAQNETYLTAAELSDPMVWMVAPPDSTSAAFGYDVNQYMWGKEQRKNAERADMAIRDAVYATQTIAVEYSKAFGMTISAEATPAIYHVLDKGCETIDLICQEIKRAYMRRRPFMVFKEPTLVPGDEEHLSKNGSYPSGHTILGWSGTLILSEINPEAAEALADRGYEYGQSRVIAGYHWQSDVNAGRVLTGAAFARLHADKAFLDDILAAREEFKKLAH